MTIIARTFASIPQRSAVATWEAISRILAPSDKSEAGRELASVSGVAASLITREAMTSPIVVYGSGPRVRIYCVYHEDAIEGAGTNEGTLPFDPMAGEWTMSLPCPADDLPWAQRALKKQSNRIVARDLDTDVDDSDKSSNPKKSTTILVDPEAFFRS
jgi:hypothetical protein